MSTFTQDPSLSQIIDGVYAIACTGNGGSELAPHPVSHGVGAASAAHPRLTDNNSINIDDHDVRAWNEWKKELRNKEEKNWKEKISPTLNGYQRKASQILEERIKFMCKKHGEHSMGVIHLTFEEDVTYQMAQDRMNSLRTNIFGKRYRGDDGLLNYVTICERGEKKKRLHFHVLVSDPHKDFRTGSYKTFNKRTNREEFHPNAVCRDEWDYFRAKLEKYGFGGMVRIEPLWSIKGGAKYFSKYVGKGHYSRDEDMRGKQLIRFGSGFRQCLGTMEIAGVRFTSQQQVNWVGGVATGRRRVLGEVTHALGVESVQALNHRYGSRWQHLCKDQMLVASALAGVRIGAKSKEFLYNYALNRWGISVHFKDDGNQIIMGRDLTQVYTPRELFEHSLNHLIDRMDEVEEFQYDMPFQG